MNELRPLLPSDCTNQACHQFSMLCCTVSPFWRRVSTLTRSGRFREAKSKPSSKKERSESCEVGAQLTRGHLGACGHRHERQAGALQGGLRAACAGIDPSNATLQAGAMAWGKKCFKRAEGAQGSLPSSGSGWKEAQKTRH